MQGYVGLSQRCDNSGRADPRAHDNTCIISQSRTRTLVGRWRTHSTAAFGSTHKHDSITSWRHRFAILCVAKVKHSALPIRLHASRPCERNADHIFAPCGMDNRNRRTNTPFQEGSTNKTTIRARTVQLEAA